MQVHDALKKLIEQVGVACGGEEGEGQTVLGNTLRRAQVETKPTKIKQVENQIQPVSEVPKSTDVVIKLHGDEQPEAARVLDAVIKQAFYFADIDPAGVKKQQTEEPSGFGRRVIFSVSDEKAPDLVRSLLDVAKTLKGLPDLKRQIRRGLYLSLNVLNKITGIKPHVKPQFFVNEAPHAELLLVGVPETLANNIALLVGKKDPWPESGDHRSRNLTQKFSGGLDVRFSLNAPYTDKVIEVIESYAAQANQLKVRGEILHETGSRSR